MIPRVSAQQAKALQDQGYLFIDVRSQPEYDAGHPVGALNVPFKVVGDHGLEPNPEFVAVMSALFPPSAKLLIVCRAGVRSLDAAEQLARLGYQDVIDVRPGYSGLRGVFGEVTERGWLACGLPDELVTEDGSYQALLARMRNVTG